jgi:hypothetical protein
MKTIDPDLAEAVSKSFCTALAVLGDAGQAEALVYEALDALNRVTGQSLRDLVVRRLVQAQLSSAH